jgi:hypothetical protein
LRIFLNQEELFRSFQILSTGKLLLTHIDFFIKSKLTPFGLLQKDKMLRTVFLAAGIQRSMEYLERSLERQTRFFEMIGVDDYLCHVGNNV